MQIILQKTLKWCDSQLHQRSRRFLERKPNLTKKKNSWIRCCMYIKCWLVKDCFKKIINDPQWKKGPEVALRRHAAQGSWTEPEKGSHKSNKDNQDWSSIYGHYLPRTPRDKKKALLVIRDMHRPAPLPTPEKQPETQRSRQYNHTQNKQHASFFLTTVLLQWNSWQNPFFSVTKPTFHTAACYCGTNQKAHKGRRHILETEWVENEPISNVYMYIALELFPLLEQERP